MKTDIQKMLLAIKAHKGWSESKIAREIGTSQPTVNRLLKGQSECKSSTYLGIQRLKERLQAGETNRQSTTHQK